MKTQRHNESKEFDCEFEERSWLWLVFRKVYRTGCAHLLDVYTLEGWAYQEHTRWVSVQQTTACTYTYNGCNGGWPYDAYTKAVIARGGEDSAADYPYIIPQAGTCKFGTGHADKPVVNIKSYANVARGQLTTALTTGPPSVCVAAEAWQTYTGGVLKTCAGDVDHCVQAVGIGGSASGAPYYIVRNSWGTSWGIKGYIYLDATVQSGDICHIQEYITHPTE